MVFRISNLCVVFHLAYNKNQILPILKYDGRITDFYVNNANYRPNYPKGRYKSR